MAIIRWILSFLVQAVDTVFGPRQTQHNSAHQHQLDMRTANLALYQFKTCPFCVKVRWAIARLGLNIEYRDAKNNETHRSALAQEGGTLKAPCLRISNVAGPDTWLYESNDIIAYLTQLADTEAARQAKA